MNVLVDGIFLELSKRFQGPSPTNADVSKLPLRALRLITRLSTTAVAAKSYELFGTIMQSSVKRETKMEAARLTLHAAYRSGLESVPPVGDPKHIFDFLRYHVGPHVEREERSHGISSVVHAIDSASSDPTSQPWTWRIEAAGELLTRFEESLDPEEFKWWYKILWLHYGGLDPDVQSRVDWIAMNEGDTVDLKQCKIAVKEEIRRVKELDGNTSVKILEEAYNRLTAFIDQREKVRYELQASGRGSFLFPPVASTSRVVNRFPSHGTGLSGIATNSFVARWPYKPYFSSLFPSVFSACFPNTLDHSIPYISAYLVPKPFFWTCLTVVAIAVT